MNVNIENIGYFWGRREGRRRMGGSIWYLGFLKKMRSKHGRLLGFDRPGDVSQMVRVSFFLFLYDGNILQCKLKVNIKRLWAEDQFSLACGQVAAAMLSSFLLLPSFPVPFRKDSPLPPSPPPALQVTAPFPLPGSPGRQGWMPFCSSPLSLCPSVSPVSLSYQMALCLNLGHHYRWLQNIGYQNTLH